MFKVGDRVVCKTSDLTEYGIHINKTYIVIECWEDGSGNNRIILKGNKWAYYDYNFILLENCRKYKIFKIRSKITGVYTMKY